MQLVSAYNETKIELWHTFVPESEFTYSIKLLNYWLPSNRSLRSCKKSAAIASLISF